MDKKKNQDAKLTTYTSQDAKAQKSKVERDENQKSYKINGVDDATAEKIKPSSFEQSAAVTSTDKALSQAHSNVLKVTNSNNIISNDTWAAMDKQFKVPSAVSQADAYLKTQLSIIQSGKTSYSEQVKDTMNQIMNREKFSYDVDTDPLFQQALASAMNSGKQAMQDTMGQASALTGGYGSTYATTAGNQAYNAFIEDAYDNLPQYYQMAMEAYQMEGDEMYRQLDMLNNADDKEYNRNLTAYDTTFNWRNRAYDEAYSMYRDNKSDAFNMANIQLSEHAQKSSDAFNYYNVTADYSNALYEREYTKWTDEINQAFQYADMLNSDYWNKTNFDEGVRQYEKNFAEEQRQFDTSFAEDQRQFNETLTEDKRQFDESLAEDKRQYDTSFAEDQRQFNMSFAEDQRQFDESLTENKRQFDENLKFQKSKQSSGGGGGSSGGDGGGGNNPITPVTGSTRTSSFNANIMTENEFNKRGKKATINGKSQVYDNYQQYVDDKIDQWMNNGELTESDVAYLVKQHLG